MNILIEDFEFQPEVVTDAADVDKLLEENELKLKTLTVRVDNRELTKELAANRTEDLLEDIQELENQIAAKQTEQSGYDPTNIKYDDIAIDLELLNARLRRLVFRRDQQLPPTDALLRNVAVGENRMLVEYYTKLQEALTAHRSTLTS